MGNNLLHWLESFTPIRPPHITCSSAGTCHQSLSIFRNRQGSYWHFFFILMQLIDFIIGQIPDTHTSRLVSENNFSLIWVQQSTIDHNTFIVEISHVSRSLKVKYFEGSIFAPRKKPFVILLKLKRSNICQMSFKSAFLVYVLLMGSSSTWFKIGRNLVNSDHIICRHTDISPIIGDSQLVDLRLRIVNLYLKLGQSWIYVPKFDRVVVTCRS